jgi:hypothetical protein
MSCTIRKSNFSHISSQLSGILCAAWVAFHSDHLIVLCSHFRRKVSEQRNWLLSLALWSKISGAISRVMATKIPRIVTKVSGAAASRNALSRLMMASITSGYFAYKQMLAAAKYQPGITSTNSQRHLYVLHGYVPDGYRLQPFATLLQTTGVDYQFYLSNHQQLNGIAPRKQWDLSA